MSDVKALEIVSMVKTSFWNSDGKPISAEEFIRSLFDDIPQLFKSEDELRKLWSIPSTHRKLLEELSDMRYIAVQLEDLSRSVQS